MGPTILADNFYLYLWRSPNSPGTLYMVQGFDHAESLSKGLDEEGYIVKVIHLASDREFQLREGKLRAPSNLAYA